MNKKSIVLCILAAITFMLGTFRVGCRIIVDDTVIPGIYNLSTARRCVALAERTAEEITRTAEAPPFRLIPVLCHKQDETDEELLYHVLLESYDGVEKLYAVSVDGRQVGILEDLWEVTALMREYPTEHVQIRNVYSHTDAADGLTHVRAVLRELEKGITGPF